ncbi:MAG TPA: ATP-binding cassette domain-containing protein [Phycisphaerae bacterium]|nr:ATP-binding cassette domain-containing protein [Phycisphaerae bacterium]
MARVLLQHVTKRYPGAGRPAVEELSLDIADHEFLVIVGPSGCGKTTTLRLIAGLETPSAGTLTIGERIVNDLPPADRDVAMVFQHYALYPHMSVYRNMAFGLHLRRKHLRLTHAQVRERVVAAARALELEAFLQRRPDSLSGGQRQRVALGRAIVRQPQVFLFDEPLSQLDANLRVATRTEIKRLQLDLRTTTVYVTHDQEEAMVLGDRIAVMKEGRIQQCAPPLEVYQRPVNRFVAGFLGTPAMNFLAGRVEGQGFVLAGGAGRLPISGALVRTAARYGGTELVLGIRPEAIGIVPEGESDSGALDAKISLVEPRGDRVDVTFTLLKGEHGAGGPQMICRSDSQAFGKWRAQGIIRVRMDLGRVHLFESGETGVNITLTRESSHAAA